MARHLIALVDCNNFFVSCERLFRPDLEKSPVVVLSSNDGCVISRSNEAKALGLRMGQPWFQVKVDPKYRDVVAFSSNFALYADISRRVKTLLSEFTPRQEVYSVDESFLDFTGMGNCREFSLELCRRVLKETGIPVCTGVAPTKTLAKLSNFIAKRHPRSQGVFLYHVLSEDQKTRVLSHVPVGEIWGIGSRLNAKLSEMGIDSALKLRDADEAAMKARFGLPVERIVLELRETPCLSVEPLREKRKQILSSRSFGKGVSVISELENAVAFHVSKIGSELRSDRLSAGEVTVFLEEDVPFEKRRGTEAASVTLVFPAKTDDTLTINRHATRALRELFRSGLKYRKAGVCVTDLCDSLCLQADFFGEEKPSKLMETIDYLNDRYGQGAVRLSQNDLSRRGWAPAKNLISPRYTTDWDELAVCR